MKAGTLIKVLQAVDPDTTVTLGIGESLDVDYRKRCAKAELMNEQCLSYLEIDAAQVIADKEEPWVELVLKQNNFTDEELESIEAVFNTRFGKKFKN